MSERCIICKREIPENGSVCNTCIQFYKWKYGKNWKRKLKITLEGIDREALEDDNNDNLNSQGGKK